MDWIFIPQLVSDYKIKRPEPSVVKIVSWVPMRPTMILEVDILALWVILQMFLMNKVRYEL